MATTTLGRMIQVLSTATLTPSGRLRVPIAQDRVRLPLLALVIGVISACGGPSHPASTPIAKEKSEMRTVVPLVRDLAPHDARPIEVEFDLPAQADDAEPPIFIGVRLTGRDSTAVAEAGDRLERADVGAVVQLEWVESSGSAKVGLERSQRVGRDQEVPVALAADGVAPGLFAFDADPMALQEAGLSSAETVSKEFAFAYSPSLPAGRYRLSLRIDRNREALIDANAQLLIAYTWKAK
ncbi:hypothetical protein XTPLMG728_3093 [Xanthomonas translucens pv. poae]|uniref:Uncharacterized protein n=1 Tax=Xanthomonas graminis pv. poae TaxID=227946 RepID=A0A0K3A433_9XANT|nr:hypothetical protein XTPLMG728_3093 [Xanthomonas translucens pv. poae]